LGWQTDGACWDFELEGLGRSPLQQFRRMTYLYYHTAHSGVFTTVCTALTTILHSLTMHKHESSVITTITIIVIIIQRHISA
jgi:hypothetical protein